MVRDPVCGMSVDESSALRVEHGGLMFAFCSLICRDRFQQDPDGYAHAGEVEIRAPAAGRIAWFSMEIGIDPAIPTYSGGLGVLAGDTLKACADLSIPVVGVSLLYRQGYFHQVLDLDGRQTELPMAWQPEAHLQRLPDTVTVNLGTREVHVGAWRYDVQSHGGVSVPVLLLDCDLDGNAPQDRALSQGLYADGDSVRLSQEIVLGIGGVRMLRQLGYRPERFHMNEGHAALLVLELLRETQIARGAWDFDAVRHACVFTTHTPVAAAYDRFDLGLAASLLAPAFPMDLVRMLGGDDALRTTRVALAMSHYVNGVAKRHSEFAHTQFPDYPIESITNGVHSVTWTCDAFRALYDKHIPGWRTDSMSLRYAMSLDGGEIGQAHAQAKAALLTLVQQRTGLLLSAQTLTIGFARRATGYKRMDLVFHDPERLRRIAQASGGLQLIFGGKAHPADEPGKRLIEHVFAMARALAPDVTIVYLADYDMTMARLMTGGVDLWLNTPRKPLEASGTSGMKAAHNGVPSLSVLDGWWLEGHIEGITGWSIGTDGQESGGDDAEASELYDKLEHKILPTYRDAPQCWLDVMRHAIAINASFFNTQRMVRQYVTGAYL